MKKIKPIFVFLFLSLATHSANSALVSFDHDDSLKWLTMDMTVDKTENEISTILSSGFTYATQGQIEALFGNNSHGDIFTHLTTTYSFIGNAFEGSIDEIYGFTYDDINNPLYTFSYLATSSALPTQFSASEFSEAKSPSYGHWLVNSSTVPEPSTNMLFGLAILGLGLFQKKIRA